MRFILRNRPSPAMIVAFIALCVALAGTATALPGRNKVRSDDIARGAVRASDIASKAVRTKHIKGRSVTRSKIANRAINSALVGTDALTGANILESSLDAVPNATNAASAAKVNGLSVQKFSFRGTPGTSLPAVLNLGGLALNASCNAGPALSVSATTTASGAIIHSGGTRNPSAPPQPEQDFYVEDDAFNVGDTFDPLDEATTLSTGLEGSLVYVRQDGGLVTASFLAAETGGNCTFAGTAIG
jgi:hypothetical protein